MTVRRHKTTSAEVLEAQGSKRSASEGSGPDPEMIPLPASRNLGGQKGKWLKRLGNLLLSAFSAEAATGGQAMRKQRTDKE